MLHGRDFDQGPCRAAQRQESTRHRQRRGLLASRVSLKARGHQAIMRVRGRGIHDRIPRAGLAIAGDDGAHPVGVRLGARDGGRGVIRRPDTRSDRKRHVRLAEGPTTAQRQRQREGCRDHHHPATFHAPSTAPSERRPLG